MRKLLLFVLLNYPLICFGQINFTGTYTQDFNTLIASGTGQTFTLSGWSINETGTGANQLYSSGTGSSNSGDTYSFGASSNSERSLGGVRSGSLVTTIGVYFTNNTGGTITTLNLSYIGEQWRLGSTGRNDRLDFQYSTDATSLTSGTWTDVNTLDFIAPISSGTTGALNGNSSINNATITGSITGLSISNGSTIFLRWNDLDATGADDGLSIDDFSISIPIPSITLNPTTLTAFTTTQNTTSTAQSYTVSGSNLTDNITITAPSGFEVSKTDASTGFAETQTLTQSGGTISSTTIYARLTGTTVGTPSGNITHISGSTSQNMAVTGNVLNQPLINISQVALSGFTTNEGSASTEQSYIVDGSNLIADISIAAPTDVEISLNASSGYTNTINLTPTGGNVAATTIYARLKGTTPGTVSGVISHTSTGALTKNLNISGNVIALPIINISTNSLTGFTTIEGSASNTQNYTVSGQNLTDNISINAPSGFEISISENSGFASSLNLNQTGGTVSNTVVYVRLTGSSQGTPTGILGHLSTGAITQEISLSGTVNANNTPTISITPTSLSGFTTIVSNASSSQSYSVSAVNLSSDLVITAPSELEISLSSSSGFTDILNISPTSGTILPTTIFVRLKGTVVGPISVNVTNASSGAATQALSVVGSVIPQPNLTLSPTTLTGFTTYVGSSSSNQGYTITGTDLLSDVTLNVSSAYEISTNPSNNFGPSVTLNPISGNLAETNIYVRLKGTEVGPVIGSVIHTSSNAETKTLQLSGTVNAIPEITITGTPMNFSTTQGFPSGNQQISVSGQNLIGNISITSPTGYEIRKGSDAYSNTVVLTHVGGVVSSTTIDIRLTGVTFGNFNGNISASSIDATTKNISVTGTVIEPTVKIRDVRATIPAQNSFTGSPVRIKGVITGIFGNNKFYMSDSTGGIAIFQSNIVSTNNLAFGDSVNVKGTTARFNGEAELLTITSVAKLTTGSLPTPKIFDSNTPPSGKSLNQFLADYEGDFVKIISVNINSTGTFATSRNYSIIACNNAGGSEIRIDAAATSFASSNNVTIPNVTQDITGVVGHFITANGGTDKLQLFPRNTSDLAASSVSCLLSSGVGGCGVASATDNPQTLDVVTWNVEWLGHPQNGPSASGSADATQILNAQTVLNSIGADVFILEEICQYNGSNPSDNTTAFGKLIQGLNNTFGANAYSGECSPAVSTSVVDVNPQRVCIIYKNSVVSKISSGVMFNNFTPSTYPPTGTPSQFWASGRKPFIFKGEINLNGQKDTINFVGLHAKSGSDAISYARRAYDVKAMYDSLQTYYPTQKVLIGGDLNDDLDVSIFPNNVSTYSPFLYANPNETNINGVRPNSDFDAVTKILSDAKCASTASFPDYIDHFIVSNELKTGSSKFNYVNGSATNIQPYSLVANYATTTSDHFPTLVRFRSQPCPSKPIISSENLAICVGSSTTLSASCPGGILNWTGGLTGNSITVSPSQSKSYKVACTLVDCTSDSSDVATVVVNSIPVSPTLEANPASIIFGQSSTLSATNCAGTITWSFNNTTGTSLVVNPSSNTTYTATCTTNNCVSDLSSITVLVSSSDPCSAQVTLTSPNDDYSSENKLKQALASNGKIFGSNKISGSSRVTYQAKSIELSPGFKADLGTIFKAEVGGCN
jgi:hypothetical protein